MGLADKFKKTEIITQQQITQPTQTSVTTTQPAQTQIINFNNNENDKNNPIIKLIQTEEFQKLSEEQQLQKLAELLPDTKTPVLKQMLTQLKTTYLSEQNQDEQHIKENNTVQTETLTEKQQQFNKLLNGQIKDKKQVQELLFSIIPELDNALPKEYTNSEMWKNLSPVEKLKKRIDALLATVMPNYPTDEGNREQIRFKLIDSIGSALDEDWNPKDGKEGKSIDEKRMLVQLTALATEASEENGMTLTQLAQKYQTNKGEVKEMFKNFAFAKFEEVMNSDKIDTTSEEWLKLNPYEQIGNIAEEILKGMNVDLPKDKKARAAFLKPWIDTIGERTYGEKNYTGGKKIAYTQSALAQINALSFFNKEYPEQKVSLKDFLDKPGLRGQITLLYNNKVGIKLDDASNGQLEIMAELANELTNEKGLTNEKAYNYLINKRNNGQLEKQQEAFLKLLEEERATCANDKAKLEKWNKEEKTDPTYGLDYAAQTRFKFDNIKDNPEYQPLIDEYHKKFGSYLDNTQGKDNQEIEASKVKEEKDISMYITICKHIEMHNKKHPDKPWDINDLSKNGAFDEIAELVRIGGNAQTLLSTLKVTNTKFDDMSKKIGEPGMAELNARTTIEGQNDEAYVQGLTNSKIKSNHNIFKNNQLKVALAGQEDPQKLELAKRSESIALKSANADTFKIEIPKTYRDGGLKDETISALEVAVLNNTTISNEVKAAYHNTTMEVAPDDNSRKFITEQAAQKAETAETLEIVGAGTKYIQSKEIKSEAQKTVITQAEQRFPDATPVIKQATETGQVSKQTLEKEPAKESEVQTKKSQETEAKNKTQNKDSKQADNTTKAQQQQAQTASATSPKGTQSTRQAAQNQTQNQSVAAYNMPQTPTTPAANPSTGNYTSSPSSAGVTHNYSADATSSTQNYAPYVPSSGISQSANPSYDLTSDYAVETPSNNRSSSVEAPAISSYDTSAASASSESSVADAQPAQAEELAAVELSQIESKQALLDKLEDIINHINETNDPIKDNGDEPALSTDQAEDLAQKFVDEGFVDNAKIQNLTEKEKSVVKQKLKEIFHNRTLSEAYDAIGSFLGESAKTKFVEILANKGQQNQILSFASSRIKEGKFDVVVQLYKKSKISELLQYLPKNVLENMLTDNSINMYEVAKYNKPALLSYLNNISTSKLNKEELYSLMSRYPDISSQIASIIIKKFPEEINNPNLPGSYAFIQNLTDRQRSFNEAPHYQDSPVENKKDNKKTLPTDNKIAEQTQNQAPEQTLPQTPAIDNNATQVQDADNKVAQNTNVPQQEAYRQEISEHFDALTSADVDEQLKAKMAGISVAELRKREQEQQAQQNDNPEQRSEEGLNLASAFMPNWKRRGRRFNVDV